MLELSFKLVYTPKRIESDAYPSIRDRKDLPILVSAILSDVDIFVTGDKVFHVIEIEKPQIITIKDLKMNIRRCKQIHDV